MYNFDVKAVKYFPPISAGTDWLAAGCNRKMANIDFTAFTVSMILFWHDLARIAPNRHETLGAAGSRGFSAVTPSQMLSVKDLSMRQPVTNADTTWHGPVTN
jgi:hypothetical protein